MPARPFFHSRSPARRPRSALVPAVALLLVAGLAACEEETLLVPSADEVASYYQSAADMSFDMNGNVAEITVAQDRAQLRRGGTLWARMTPYMYLFSAGTEQLFVDYNGLAAVRVITMAGDERVARVTLSRGSLNELTWRRTLNISGLARRDGAEQLTLLEDLIRWGEDHTEYEYNERYTSR